MKEGTEGTSGPPAGGQTLPRDDRAGLIALTAQPLLQECAPGPRLSKPLRAVLEETAWGTDSLEERADRLLNALRKRLGQSELLDWLDGLAALARAGEPAGARLLAALLAVHAPGAEMVAQIHRFDSSRRLLALVRRGGEPGPPEAWLRRLRDVEAASRVREERGGGAAAAATTGAVGPRDEPPFPLLRRTLELLLADLARDGDLSDADKDLLVGLARLEVDAYEERVSRLAGSVNPYLASAVTRVLPLLGQADATVRALNDFIRSLEAGRAGAAFRRRCPRYSEVLADDEQAALLRQMESRTSTAELAALLRALARNPMPTRRLAGAVGRLMALAHGLRQRALRRTELDLLTAAAIVLGGERDGELELLVGGQLQAVVAEILDRRARLSALPAPAAAAPLALDEAGTGSWLALPMLDAPGTAAAGPPPAAAAAALPPPGGESPPEQALPAVVAEAGGRRPWGAPSPPAATTPAATTTGPASAPGSAPAALAANPAAGSGADPYSLWPLDGFVLRGERLLLRVPDDGRSDRIWRDDLPCRATDEAEAAAATRTAEIDTAALKRLVLANLDNVSVTIGFLRNAKVVAIPGLVAQIVHRCRTVRVLEIIAQDRTLHSGYANKDVPRALLMSPCNIPVKSLSKFIHVKYVNKVDLQRMAKDRTGIRRELIKEIESYLATLGG